MQQQQQASDKSKRKRYQALVFGTSPLGPPRSSSFAHVSFFLFPWLYIQINQKGPCPSLPWRLSFPLVTHPQETINTHPAAVCETSRRQQTAPGRRGLLLLPSSFLLARYLSPTQSPPLHPPLLLLVPPSVLPASLQSSSIRARAPRCRPWPRRPWWPSPCAPACCR